MTEPADNRRVRITDPTEQLLRPIIANWVVGGHVAPDAFKLSTADKRDSNHLSVARASATTPERAYKDRAEHIEKRCKATGRPYTPPVGVLAVTVDDVESVEVKSPENSSARKPLTVWDDSMNEDVPDDHGHIDYNDVPPSDRGAHDLAAKTLLAKAMERGWKFGPVTG